jgi:hypothetical protein
MQGDREALFSGLPSARGPRHATDPSRRRLESTELRGRRWTFRSRFAGWLQELMGQAVDPLTTKVSKPVFMAEDA